MQYRASWDEYDEESPGRIVGDTELSHALETRNDIFNAEENPLLRRIGFVAILMGVACGIWLNSTPPFNVISRSIKKHNITNLIASSQKIQSEPEDIALPLGDISLSNDFVKRSSGNFGLIAKKPLMIDKHTKISDTLSKMLSDTKKSSRENSVAISNTNTTEPSSLIKNQSQENQTTDDSILVSQGNAFKKQNKHGEAFAAFQKALEHDPHNTAALSGLGDMFLITGLLDSAARIYRSAITINPRCVSAHNGLGTVCYYISTLAANVHYANNHNIADPERYIKLQYDSAIAEYTNAISLDSSCVDAMTNRGVIRDIHGDHNAALADYTLAVNRNPTWAEGYNKRGDTYRSLGKYHEAIADYTKSISLDTSSYIYNPTIHLANAYFGRGIAEYKLHDYINAVSDYDSTLILEPKHSLAMQNKALSYAEAGMYDSAIASYTKAIATLSPSEYSGALERAYSGRGHMYDLTNHLDFALNDFDAAIKLNPNDGQVRIYRGDILKSEGKVEDAIADYKMALYFPKFAEKAKQRLAECKETSAK